MIEHNLDVIKTADWVIDMGPEGGSRGGTVIAEGTPEQIAGNGDSYTGVYLKPDPGRSRRAGGLDPTGVAGAAIGAGPEGCGAEGAGEDRQQDRRKKAPAEKAPRQDRGQEDDRAGAGPQGELNPDRRGSV